MQLVHLTDTCIKNMDYVWRVSTSAQAGLSSTSTLTLSKTIGPTRQNTLFALTRPGILEEGRSVGARGVATPTKAELDMQLASKLVLALLVTDSCRSHPLIFVNWVTNIVCKKKKWVGRVTGNKVFVWSALPPTNISLVTRLGVGAGLKRTAPATPFGETRNIDSRKYY